MYATIVSKKFEVTYKKSKLCNVATIFNSANMLIMDLESPLEHCWDENLANVWNNIAFPEDVSDMFFVVDERGDYENNDKSSGKENSEEYLSDSSDSEESDIEYY